MMDEKPCWKYSNNASFSCTMHEPPETLSAISRIKEWMRVTQCLSLSGSLYCLNTAIIDAGTTLVTTTADATDQSVVAASLYWNDFHLKYPCPRDRHTTIYLSTWALSKHSTIDDTR